MNPHLFKSLFVGLALALNACATPARQTMQLLNDPGDLPRTAEVAHVPFVLQSDGYCGPATLTMALNQAGKNVSVEQVAPLVFTPGAKGSFQTDMLVGARRLGMLAIPVRGMPDLLKEISVGNPVIIFENLALPWYPRWHYVLAYGYDLDQETITLNDGNTEGRRWSLRKLERSWVLTEYWGFTVLAPGKLSATGTQLAHSTAGAALEQSGKITAAERVYKSILTKWPTSLAALMGLGNTAFTLQDYSTSVGYLKKATELHSLSAAAWHNLAYAEGKAQLKSSAKISALRALKLVSPEAHATYEKSLEEWVR